MAPAESRHTASRAPEPLRDDPFAELSPGTVSAAPLLHPQLQRELIEQAAGMSTRQVANLLAAAAPEVLPPRDTLRAVAPDRYTLKVSIDQECEQGLRLLKDLMSHVDPRMSWGDLVARLVREAVTRHDPRGGGSGQRRRRSAGSAGASPRRAPKETRAAGPAQRVDESSGRAPNRTRADMAPAVPARRTGCATPASPGNTAATERQNPIGVLASAAPPSQSAPASPLDGARAGGVPSGAAAAASAPQSAPAVLLDGARAGGAGAAAASIGRGRRCFGAAVGARGTVGWRPCRRRSIGRGRRYFGAAVGARGTTCWMAPVQAALHFGAAVGARGTVGWRPCRWRSAAAAAAPQSAPAVLLDGARAGGARPPLLRRRSSRPAPWRLAPMPAQVCRARRSPLRRRSRHLAGPLTADRAAPQLEQRAGPRRLASLRLQACRARPSPLRRRSRHSAGPLTADRAARRLEQRRTRPANLFTAATNPHRGATFPRRSGATSGNATVDAAAIASRSPGGAAPLPICCRSTTCCQSPRGVARSRPISSCCALLITECATATVRLLRRSPQCSASSALLARRSTALADGLQVARRGYTSQPREPSVHLRYRLCRLGPVAVDALTHGVVVVSRLRFPAASGVRTRCSARV